MHNVVNFVLYVFLVSVLAKFHLNPNEVGKIIIRVGVDYSPKWVSPVGLPLFDKVFSTPNSTQEYVPYW